MWVTKTLKKRLIWNFTYSCQCLESHQKQVDAAYYNRRGRFYILRSINNLGSSSQDINIALDYLGEAITQDPKSREIIHSQRLALVAARRIKNDLELDASIAEARRQGVPQTSLINPRDSSPGGIFRNQYLQLIYSEDDFHSLERHLDQLNVFATEWSYSLASGLDRFSPLEIGFDGDDDQYRNSMAEAPAPLEMLGSIPSLDNDQAVLARGVTEQSDEHGVTAQIPRRLSELADEQVIPGQRRSSVFSYEQNLAARRRPSILSHEQNDRNQRRISELGSEQGDIAQRTSSVVSMERRASEFSIDQMFAARRPSVRNEIQRRGSELSNSQSPTSQTIKSELFSDVGNTAQRIPESEGNESFNIYG